MAKIVSIPSYIVTSSDDTYYFNLVNNGPTKVGTITRNVNNMEVTDISLNQVKTLLGGTTFSLFDTCRLASVNDDSYYKPSGVSPYRMGDFAGYNHLAKPPTYFASRPATDDIDVDYDGANYKIITSARLRRGERLPYYLNSEGAWVNIRVDFELYSYTGGFLGSLIDSTSITGIAVTRMSVDTVIQSGTLSVPNSDASYMLYVKVLYTTSAILPGNPIEDDDLHTVITSYMIRSWIMGYYVGNWAAMEPFEGATTRSVNVFNGVADVRNAQTFQGVFKCTYWWYESPDSYPSKSYAYSTDSLSTALYPGGSTSNYETVIMTFPSAIGVKDTRYDRNLLVEYKESGGSWQTLFDHTWTGV